MDLSELRANLKEQSGRILILMQEGDLGGNTGDFVNVEWADEMFDAHTLIEKAIEALERAESYE